MDGYIKEEFLGQIWAEGRWMDYARGTEQAARDWLRREEAAGRRARVVDWIHKGTILFGEGANS